MNEQSSSPTGVSPWPWGCPLTSAVCAPLSLVSSLQQTTRVCSQVEASQSLLGVSI